MNPVALTSLLIVVPTLNSYTLLPRMLLSLQQQSWPHWRLLFIDGPSDPEHRRWLLQCCSAEPRCRWVAQSQEQPGIFGAMNQGFALAAPDVWFSGQGQMTTTWVAKFNAAAGRAAKAEQGAAVQLAVREARQEV